MARSERLAYATADDGEKYRLCATSLAKSVAAQQLVRAHAGEQILVIGQYLGQLDELAARLDAPLINGTTPVAERERLFGEFREGRLSTLVVSKVANFSIDLPEASVAIQVSGAFGSRQEEAQRLGRLMRPKTDGRTARFYTLVARDTVDADFAAKRQRLQDHGRPGCSPRARGRAGVGSKNSGSLPRHSVPSARRRHGHRGVSCCALRSRQD